MFSRMKFVALSVFVLLLAACGSGAVEQEIANLGSEQDSQEAAASSRQTARLDQGGERALPVQTQLILGTLQLESTNLAVGSDQASELVPLWKALRSMTNSDTAAEAEIEALINQIQDTMTAEQIEAIEAMDLSPDELQTIIQDLGLTYGPPEGFDGIGEGDFQSRPGAGDFASGGGGGGPLGGGRQSGAIPGGEGDIDREAAATARAEGGITGFNSRAGGFLMEPLIELLELRAGLESTA